MTDTISPTLGVAGKTGTTLKVGGKLLGQFGVVASTSDAIDHGFRTYDAINDPNASKQDVVIHGGASAANGTAAIAGTTSLAMPALATAGVVTGTTATAVGTASTGVGLVLLPIILLGPYTSASSHYDIYDINTAYTPSASKRHMIGIASGKLRDQLANPSTGEIDWADERMLEKYSALLTTHIDNLDKNIRVNDSAIPDGIRIFYLGGEKNVMAQLDRRDEMQLARTALTEVKQQMRDVWQLKELEKEIQTAQSKLTGGTFRELALADLDRDGDSVLTKADMDAIRLTAKNDKFTDVLFAQLANLPDKQKVTFENQSLKELEQAMNGGHIADVHAPHTLNTLPPQPVIKPRKKTFGDIIAGGLASVINGIGSVLSSLLGFATPASTNNNIVVADAGDKTQHPRSGGKDPMEDVVVPVVGFQTNNASLKR